MELSILISSHDRLPLLRRTLWSIAHNPPPCPFEVVLCDDGSTEDTLGELRRQATFPWRFVRFDRAAFESATGLSRFHGNPAVTNNLAFAHSRGALVALQGNEVIATPGCYQRLLDTGRWMARDLKHWLVFSTTYDVPAHELALLGEHGSNLTAAQVKRCQKWPLQHTSYRSDVTNYVSLCPRELWERIGGYDERYYAGIACEDSDFVRRARALDGFGTAIADAVSLHQSHGGMTRYYQPDPRNITMSRWDEGLAINRAVFHAWDGQAKSAQPWPMAAHGTGEVVEG